MKSMQQLLFIIFILCFCFLENSFQNFLEFVWQITLQLSSSTFWDLAELKESLSFHPTLSHGQFPSKSRLQFIIVLDLFGLRNLF